MGGMRMQMAFIAAGNAESVREGTETSLLLA